MYIGANVGQASSGGGVVDGRGATPAAVVGADTSSVESLCSTTRGMTIPATMATSTPTTSKIMTNLDLRTLQTVGRSEEEVSSSLSPPVFSAFREQPSDPMEFGEIILQKRKDGTNGSEESREEAGND